MRTTSGRTDYPSEGLHEEVSRNYLQEPRLKSRVSSQRTVTLPAGRRKNRGSIPSRGKKFSSSAKPLFFNGHWKLFPGGKEARECG